MAAKVYSALRRAIPFPVLEDATMHSWESYSETVRRVIVAAEGSAWLTAAQCDVTLVVGTEDEYLDLEYLRDLTVRLPNVDLHVLPGEGHDLPLTQPAKCLSIIDNEAPPLRLAGASTRSRREG
jgi:pimeloyl-ACP methyl ester carboxylesterase